MYLASKLSVLWHSIWLQKTDMQAPISLTTTAIIIKCNAHASSPIFGMKLKETRGTVFHFPESAHQWRRFSVYWGALQMADKHDLPRKAKRSGRQLIQERMGKTLFRGATCCYSLVPRAHKMLVAEPVYLDQHRRSECFNDTQNWHSPVLVWVVEEG